LENALKKMPDSAAGLIEGLPGIILGMGPDGQVVVASDEAVTIFGPEIRGATLSDVLHPEDAAGVILKGLIPSSSFPGNGEDKFRLRLRSASGDYLRFEGALRKMGLESSPCSFVLNLFQSDPAERKAAQLAEIIEGSVQGLVVHRQGRPLFCNSAMAEMLDFASREAVLREGSINPFIHEADRAMVLGNIRARLEGKDAPSNYEFRMRTLNGEILWVDCRASIVDWEGGPAVLASCFDITARKKAEWAQRRSDELFSRVFQISPDFMTLTRIRDNLLIDVNDVFLSTFGYERYDVIGHSALDLGLWWSAEERQKILDSVAQDGAVRNREAWGRKKDGGRLELEISAEILDVHDERILLVIGRDIKQRKLHEAELMASKEAADLANKSKSDFLANMSHELRTPLNAILGFSEIIRNQILGPIEEIKYTEYARDIYESGTHLLDIINDILDLSKIEAGRLEVHEGRVDIAELFGICQRLIEPKVAENNLHLTVEKPESLPCLMADHRLMKQILLNLLSNAVKFTPEGGLIRVSAVLSENGALVISVEDSGIGMDEKGVERALALFGQVDTSFSRKHQGSGLGLPLVIAFTERQGGTFDLDTAPGEGTRITITFPKEKLVCEGL